MKNSIGLVLTCAIFASHTLFAKQREFPEVKQTIPLTELSSEMIEEFIGGNFPEDLALECLEGTELSPDFLFNFGIVSCKCNPLITLRIDKPFYFRMFHRKAYVSSDLVNWGKLDHFRTTKTKLKLSQDKTRVGVTVDFMPDEEECEDQLSLE